MIPGYLTLSLLQENSAPVEGAPDVEVDVEEIKAAHRHYYTSNGRQVEGARLQLRSGRELIVAEPLAYVLEMTCLWQLFLDLQEKHGRRLTAACQEVSSRGGSLARGKDGALYIRYPDGSQAKFNGRDAFKDIADSAV